MKLGCTLVILINTVAKNRKKSHEKYNTLLLLYNDCTYWHESSLETVGVVRFTVLNATTEQLSIMPKARLE